MADEKKLVESEEDGSGVDYPVEFPEQGYQDCLNYLRGGGDAVSAAHGAWELQGYAMHELVGDPGGNAPVVHADASAPPTTAPVPAQQMRSLRLGVNLNQVHFGPVTHEALANQLESLANQHKNFKQQGDNSVHKVGANGQWLKMLLPIAIQILQQVLGGM